MADAIAVNSAKNVNGFTGVSDEISDPPQKIEAEDIQNCLNNLISVLQQ